MKKLYYAALAYMVLGVAAGLYYREYTKAHAFTGDTQLSVMHTHLLALGMLTFLALLALDKPFALSATRVFGLFFLFYNAGLVLTVGMMAVHGTRTVLGKGDSPALDGISGLGHIPLTVGLILLFPALGKRVLATRDESTPRLDASTNSPAVHQATVQQARRPHRAGTATHGHAPRRRPDPGSPRGRTPAWSKTLCQTAIGSR